MYLIYIDESGNSGLNLSDPAQPLFALCAMMLPEDRWQPLEQDLKAVLDRRVPDWATREKFEVHASDIRRGDGHFQGIPCSDRIAFRDEWMRVGQSHGVRLSYSTVHKSKYAQWLVERFGHGVVINPHVPAFLLLSRCVDTYLQTLPGRPLGIFISDENKEVVADIEKSIRVLRSEVGTLRLGQIIEKGFFIDSKKSLPLQLCDLFTLSLRKRTERMRKCSEPKSFDDSGIAIAESLIYQNDTQNPDVLNWLVEQRKKEAARG